jgi:hypothetical protein
LLWGTEFSIINTLERRITEQSGGSNRKPAVESTEATSTSTTNTALPQTARTLEKTAPPTKAVEPSRLDIVLGNIKVEQQLICSDSDIYQLLVCPLKKNLWRENLFPSFCFLLFFSSSVFFLLPLCLRDSL